ncbi:MAG: hypothetical protein ABIP53_02840 [Candidatus Limnocylindrales bacterium]
MQLGVSVPFYHARYNDGFTSSGRGDVYLSSKVRIASADDHRVGLAVLPLIEVLSDASLSDTTLGLKRVNWAIPVTVEAGTDSTQAFLTTGYFSRGAIFAGVGLTHALNERLSVLGSFNISHSTKGLSATDLAGLSRSRADASAGVSIVLSPRVGFFASLGRTVSKLDQNGAKLIASAALSVSIGRARP